MTGAARGDDDPSQDFSLFETMRHDVGDGLHHGDAHLARLESSARAFGFHFDGDVVRRTLYDRLDDAGDARVRLSCRADGTVSVEVTPLPHRPPGPVRLAVDGEPVDGSTCWTRHKTSRRETYTVRLTRHPEADDAVLVDGRGEVMETCIANLAARIDDVWWTPPLSVGCLPGVERAHRIHHGELRERPITVPDLVSAEAVAVLSSLRGWRSATLVGPVPTSSPAR